MAENRLLRNADALMPRVERSMHELAAKLGGALLGGLVEEHLATGGKRLRARLALAAIEAFGGDPRSGCGWAAACELFHNATLIHDDLQDGDHVRRGSPTLWVAHGMPQAVNAGDLMLLLPIAAVATLDLPDSVRWSLCCRFVERGCAVIGGQASEMELNRMERPTWESYLATILGKTSGLFELPVEGAALIAGRTVEQAARLAMPMRELGALFQLQDDVLDLFGDKGREAPGGDLREGKVSILVVEHLLAHPEDEKELRDLLRAPREQTSQSAVDAMRAKMGEGGALEGAVRRIRELASSIERNEGLRGETSFAALVRALVEVVLLPIEPVMRRF